MSERLLIECDHCGATTDPAGRRLYRIGHYFDGVETVPDTTKLDLCLGCACDILHRLATDSPEMGPKIVTLAKKGLR